MKQYLEYKTTERHEIQYLKSKMVILLKSHQHVEEI